MPKLIADISMSLDGLVAGPDPTLEDPLGAGGEQLHEWAYPLAAWRAPHGLSGGEEGAESELVEESLRTTGAVVMGRRMFSGGAGPWDATRTPTGGGATTHRSTSRSSSSPTTRARRWRSKAGLPSRSSPTGSTAPSSGARSGRRQERLGRRRRERRAAGTRRGPPRRASGARRADPPGWRHVAPRGRRPSPARGDARDRGAARDPHPLPRRLEV